MTSKFNNYKLGKNSKSKGKKNKFINKINKFILNMCTTVQLQ